MRRSAVRCELVVITGVLRCFGRGITPGRRQKNYIWGKKKVKIEK